MLDFLGLRWFVGLLVLLALDLVWLVAMGHTIDAGSLWRTLVVAGGMLALMLACGRFSSAFAARVPTERRAAFIRRMHLLRHVSEVFLFITLGWVALRLYNHLSMTLPVPYADALLASLDDRFFGIWNGYFEFIATRPLLITVQDWAYASLSPLTIFACYYLLLAGHGQKCRFFIYTFTTTAIVATTIGMLFPAKAAVATILENQDLLSAFPEKPGWYSIEIIERLRTQNGIVFNFDDLPGLTTFPSFHTAAGVVLVYSFRQTRLFFPSAAYAAVMIASTPVFGGHYLVDLLAGTILAIGVCRWFEKSREFRGLFSGGGHGQPATGPMPAGH